MTAPASQKEHRVRPDLSHARNIPYPTPMECHLNPLLLHRGQTARRRIALQERPPTLRALLTAKSLLAVTCLAILHHGFTLTVRTLHGCLCPRFFLLQALCSPSSCQSTNWRHYRKLPICSHINMATYSRIELATRRPFWLFVGRCFC